MVRKFDVRPIAGTTPTSIGTKDFTAPGVGGQPKGAIVRVARTDAEGDHQPHEVLSIGCTDGVTDRCIGIKSLDNVATSDSTHYSTDLRVVHLIDASATDQSIVEASFDSWVDDGIRLNFTKVDTTAWEVTVTLFFGTDCDIEAWVQPIGLDGGASLTINVGMEPTLIYSVHSTLNFTETYLGETRLGEAWSDPAAEVSTYLTSGADDGTANSITLQANYDTRTSFSYLMGGAPPLVGNSTKVVNRTATGWDQKAFTLPIVGASPRVFGLAIRASDLSVKVVHGDTAPTSPATQTKSLGFKPGFLAVLGSRNTAAGFQNHAFHSSGHTDFREAHTLYTHNAHGQATMVTGCRYHDTDVFLMYGNTGVGVLRLAAVANNRDSDGFDLVFSTSSVAHRFGYAAIEEAPFEGALDVVLPGVTAEIAGDVVYPAALDTLLPSPTAELAGAMIQTGALDAIIPAVTAELVGRQVDTAALDALLPSPTAELTGLPVTVGSYDALLPSPTAELVGALVTAAAIDAALPSPTAEIVAEMVTGGAVDALLASPSAELAGRLVAPGALDALISAVIAELAGEIVTSPATDGCWVLMSRAIRNRFETEVEVAGGLPVQHPNESEPPRGLAQAWMSLAIEVSDHRQESLGLSFYRKTGEATARVYVPLAEGEGRLLEFVDVIVLAFRGVSADQVCYRVPSLSTFQREGRWWVADVSVPFLYTDDSGVTA